jgi:hypothetical protein
MTATSSLKLKSRIFRASTFFVTLLAVLTVLAATSTAQNPVPFLDQPLVPDAAAPGGPGFTLTLNGAGFGAGSVVNWNGSPRATTFVRSSQLTAAILASDIATASTASVTVVNPRPGGGPSNAQFFSIVVAAPEGKSVFLPVVTYTAGVTYTAVADVNGDGKPDLVVSNSCANNACSFGDVGILLGNGDGTFQAEMGYYDSGGNHATSVAVADVNGDGKPDVIVTNQGFEPGALGPVGVLLGNGDGTFQPAVTYSSGASSALFAAVADVNGDGKLDLLVANEVGTVGVLLGNGDGTFQAAVVYDSGQDVSNFIVAADLRGDGRLDIVVTGDTVNVLLGNGDGTFQPAISYGNASSVAVADVDGDGRPDLVIGENGALVGILLGNGDGTFQEPVIYSTGASSLTWPTVADMNGDGKPDLVVSNLCASVSSCGYGSVSVLLGNGDGTFQPATSYDSGGNVSSVVVADLNGDGTPDAVATNQASGICCGSSVSVLLNNTGLHTPTTTTPASSMNPVAIGMTVTYTATVAGESDAAVTGTVTFQDAGSTIAIVKLSAGQTAYSTSYTAPGVHPITASYSGDVHNSPSTSSTLSEDAAGGPSKTTLTTSGSPSLAGQSVTFAATVTSKDGTIPNGETVTFYDGATAIGAGTTASGVARFTTSSLTAKTHAIKATFPGDATFGASAGSVKQVVDNYPTTTTLSSTPNPSNYGQAVTLTARVTSAGPAPTGSVTFKNGTASLGVVTLNGGVATFTTAKIPVGANTLTSTYNEDAFNGKSVSAAITQTVNRASVSMTLTSTPNPSTLGKSVKFTARLTSNGGLPTGQPVTFSYNGATLGTANVTTTGVATFSTETLPAGGSDVVTAAYAGSVDYSSASASVTQVVN